MTPDLHGHGHTILPSPLLSHTTCTVVVKKCTLSSVENEQAPEDAHNQSDSSIQRVVVGMRGGSTYTRTLILPSLHPLSLSLSHTRSLFHCVRASPSTNDRTQGNKRHPAEFDAAPARARTNDCHQASLIRGCCSRGRISGPCLPGPCHPARPPSPSGLAATNNKQTHTCTRSRDSGTLPVTKTLLRLYRIVLGAPSNRMK